MNKGNKILLGILAFVVVCVVGYALFGETITVTGSATASGEWSMTTTCQPGIASEVVLGGSNPEYLITDGGYQNDSCQVNGSSLSMKVNLLYPSARRLFTIKVKNTGNVDAVFDLSEADEDGGFSNTNINVCELNENNQKVNCDSEMNYVGEIASGSSTVAVFSILGGQDAQGNFYHPYSGGGMEDKFSDPEHGYVLEPGESFYYYIIIRWPNMYDNLTNKASFAIDLSTQLKFIQVQ